MISLNSRHEFFQVPVVRVIATRGLANNLDEQHQRRNEESIQGAGGGTSPSSSGVRDRDRGVTSGGQ